MKRNTLLIILSVLSVFFMALHFADDIARGIEPGRLPTLIGVLILGVWLYGALVLPERRSGLVILFLGSLFGLAVLFVHLQGAGVGRIARSSGGLFFVWTLIALGTTSLLSLVLSASGLWSLRRGQPR